MKEQEHDWLAEVEEEREKIKQWKLTDRLSIVSKLSFMNGTMAASVTGWNAWFSSVLIMENLREEELKELVIIFEKLALDFLELDLKYTRILKERQNEGKTRKIADLKEKQKQEAKKKVSYVA